MADKPGAKNKTTIMACSSMTEQLRQAQLNAGTDYPVIWLPRDLHRDPSLMRDRINEELKAFASEDEDGTLLVVMGWCGGSWEGVKAPVRVVLPAVDDCVSLMLSVDDRAIFDRKTPGHIYYKNRDPHTLSIKRIFYSMAEGQDLDPETVEEYHRHWQDIYSGVDIVDTGLWDSRTEDYVACAKEDAEFLDAELGFVPGGIRLIEKLLRGAETGDWDEQFMVFGPGETIRLKK